MKAMFRILMLAAGIAVAALPAARAADENPPAPDTPNADQPAARPERRGRRMDPARMLGRLKTELNLTDDQTAKVKTIFEDQRAKMQALRGDESLSREDRRAKMMDLMKASRDQIRALLTPEQQQKFDAMPRPGRGPRGEGPAGGPPPPPPTDNAAPPPPPPPPPPPGGPA
jgi:periplasmic protein CpxP/Spy